ncbi:hypothetical protein L484_006852 [Morus notabilis]|uniref:Uncharacterized protein n=1 Tax=Morus notabilis TaxID=981085 RepID=W9RKZ3_9ROSA|nr:hypothetical protein L484_006852 [Morus notabilis]
MSALKEGKNKRKTIIEPNKAISWRERKHLADREEEALKQDIKDLNTWANMIDGMNDQQLRGYIENRPEELKTVKITKSNTARPKIQKIGKSKSSASNSGIMASVWKFHKEDGEEDQLNVMSADIIS